MNEKVPEIHDAYIELQKERDFLISKIESARSNLACIADALNTWCRESDFPEVTDYLGLCVLRDHLQELNGHINAKIAEVARLRESNAELVAAAKEAKIALEKLNMEPIPAYKMLDEAIAKAEEKTKGGSSANYVPPGAMALPNDEGNC
jgi:predicted nuclease with TOPRIM domain